MAPQYARTLIDPRSNVDIMLGYEGYIYLGTLLDPLFQHHTTHYQLDEKLKAQQSTSTNDA